MILFMFFNGVTYDRYSSLLTSTDWSPHLYCFCKAILVVAKVVPVLWELGDIRVPRSWECRGRVDEGGWVLGDRRMLRRLGASSPFVQTVGMPLLCMQKV